MKTAFFSCSLLSCMHCGPPSHFSFLEFVPLCITKLQISLFLIKISTLITFPPKTLFSWQIIGREHILYLKTWICVSENPHIFKLYFCVYTKHNWPFHERWCKHTSMSETLNDFLPLLLHIHENAKILLHFFFFIIPHFSSPLFSFPAYGHFFQQLLVFHFS